MIQISNSSYIHYSSVSSSTTSCYSPTAIVQEGYTGIIKIYYYCIIVTYNNDSTINMLHEFLCLAILLLEDCRFIQSTCKSYQLIHEH